VISSVRKGRHRFSNESQPFLALVLALALVSPVAARTKGIFFSPRLLLAGVSVEDENEVDDGGGLGLRAGYGFTPTVTGYLAIEGARISSGNEDVFGVDSEYDLGVADLGAQFNLLPSSKVNPFLRVAHNASSVRLNVERVSQNNDPVLNGSGLTLGGGAELRLSRKLAADRADDITGGRITSAKYFDVIVEGEGDSYGIVRLGSGLVWRR
jgi:hypothetical protein